MQILVATRNTDKYTIVRRMVEATVPDAFLVSLEESKVPGDVVEVGTIQQRAVQKAVYFAERLEQLGRADEYDAVLAIDDGLSVDGEEASPNSKELTDRILGGEWQRGTTISVVRAFALIKRGERPRVETTAVPFVFIGNDAKAQRSTGRYPLSQVLAPPGTTRAVAQLTKDEEDHFNLTHSTEALEALFA